MPRPDLFRPFLLHTRHRADVVSTLRSESKRFRGEDKPGLMLRDLAEAYHAAVTGDLTRLPLERLGSIADRFCGLNDTLVGMMENSSATVAAVAGLEGNSHEH